MQLDVKLNSVTKNINGLSEQHRFTIRFFGRILT
jgi:hypothetical protein